MSSEQLAGLIAISLAELTIIVNIKEIVEMM